MQKKGDRAKVFRHGGSQAVRLPKKYRFEDDEVSIRRDGKRVVLEPIARGWTNRFLALAGSAPDYPYPVEPSPAEDGPDLD
jgi:antitoxin VapB